MDNMISWYDVALWRKIKIPISPKGICHCQKTPQKNENHPGQLLPSLDIRPKSPSIAKNLQTGHNIYQAASIMEKKINRLIIFKKQKKT
jgi:hypothetical protein